VIISKKKLLLGLEEWYNIDANIYQNLVDSMPRRVAAVMQSKGNPTKY
jgi:hypothetical protein